MAGACGADTPTHIATTTTQHQPAATRISISGSRDHLHHPPPSLGSRRGRGWGVKEFNHISTISTSTISTINIYHIYYLRLHTSSVSALLCTAFYADNILALLNFFLECFDDLIPPEIVLELRIEIFSRAEQVSLGSVWWWRHIV